VGRRDPVFGPIDEQYGLPKEMLACPGCGKVYGAWGRRACEACEECEKCCTCPVNKQRLVSGAEMKERAANSA
jgi:hypothetical protein